MTIAGGTFRLPVERDVWFQDFDGVWATYKFNASTVSYVLDFTDLLPSGVTLSSVAWDDLGVTLTNESTSSPTHTLTVSGTGEGTAKLTLSDSDVRYIRFRWKNPEGRVRDYA